MDKLFLTILNMSLTGAFVIAAICIARLPLKKAPKIISYCLWAAAGFRLVFPFSIESVFSLIPFKAQTIPPDIAMQTIPRIDSGIPFVNNAVSSILPAATPISSINPLQVWTIIGAYVWLIGAAVILIYGMGSIVILKRNMRKAIHIEADIYEAENIKSPFVLGILKPRIYLPTGLSQQEKSYIILHEQTHIRRHDHIIKFAAYFILCLHWFNPFAWAAFLLMGIDMEMSCDERVLKEMGGEVKKDYSLSLLSLAADKRIINGSPLAFSEGGIKERIKNILNFKKPSRVIIIVAALSATVLGVGFAMNRSVNAPLIEMKMVYEENPAFFLNDMKLIWDDDVYYVTPMNNTGQGKEIGYAVDEYSTWRIYELKGYDSDYLLAVESEDVWRVMSVNPPEAPWRQYVLENATERQKAERMLSVTLYNDGTANLATPPISSYLLLSPYYYTFTDDELLIYYDTDNIIAKFTVIDENTLVFKEASVLLFADKGTRYVSTSSIPSAAAYEPREWFNYFYNDKLPWGDSFDLELPEYPDTVFRWTPEKVIAVTADGAKELFSGMPVWNIYLADLTGDVRPELCATISIGSGVIDNRVVVYDYSTQMLYELSDRMKYDYALSLENERLIVTKTEYNGGAAIVAGDLVIEKGELIIADTSETALYKPLEKAPRLEISLIEDGLSKQQIQAAQLTTSWYFVDENGDGRGYEADSPHALQLRGYDDMTLQMNETNSEVKLQFTDDYPPQSVSIQRWDAEYAVGSQDIADALDKSESIKANGDTVHIVNDGHDYVYEVYAKWEQGSSWYAFRIDSK